MRGAPGAPLLRHPDAHLKSSQAWRCDGLASARVFGERAEAVWWCPHGQACRAVTNATADAAVAAGPMAALDGGLWRGENFVSVLKELLASEREWKGGSAQQQHNHATMQQMQGNGEIARKLYAKVLAPWSSPELAPSVDVLAHAYGNLAQLERGAAARRQLEAALSRRPPARAQRCGGARSPRSTRWARKPRWHATRRRRRSSSVPIPRLRTR